MTTIQQWLIENMKSFDDREDLIKTCVKEMGVGRKSVVNKAKNVWPIEKIQLADADDKDVRRANEFLGELDLVKKVKDFLDEVVRDGYIEDNKLQNKFSSSQTQWKRLRELPLFEGRIFPYTNSSGRKITVWSSVEGVERAKATISMTKYEV